MVNVVIIGVFITVSKDWWQVRKLVTTQECWYVTILVTLSVEEDSY